MKKLVCIMGIFLMLAFIPSAFAGQITLNFAWEQATVDVNTGIFYGWKMYVSETPGGPYTQIGGDIVYDGTPAPEYTATEVLTSPDGQMKTYYFVVNAWDKQGRYSANSNEVSVDVDFTSGPSIPVNLRVIIESGGNN